MKILQISVAGLLRLKSIHFGENKTKSILFAPKMRVKKVDKLDITSKS